MESEYDERPIPVVPGAEDEIEFDERLSEALDDTEPTDRQKALMRRGGILIVPSDRSDVGGVPIGDSPDNVAGMKVIMRTLDPADGPSAELIMSGRNDPIMREAFSKLANVTGTAEERLVAASEAFINAANMKKQQRDKAALFDTKSTPKPVSKLLPKSQVQVARETKATSQVEVLFDLGIAGKQRARYSNVEIYDKVLVLSSTSADRSAGMYLPPEFGSENPIIVTIPGLQNPVPVYSAGLVFPHGDELICVLLIEREEN